MESAAITSLRGTGGKSPFNGRVVQTTGEVTYVDDRGFLMQDPKDSGGIYVFTKDAPKVHAGDEVSVVGLVMEYKNMRAGPNERGTTQLRAQNNAVKVTAKGTRVPAPTILGEGGLDPKDPSTFEHLEGVRVQIPDAMVVGSPNHIRPWADMYVIANGSNASPRGRTSAGGVLREGSPDVAPIGIRLRVDEISGRPNLNVRAKLGDLVGHIVFRFGRPQVQIDDPVLASDVKQSDLKPESTQLSPIKNKPADELFVGSLNVENKDVRYENIALVQNRDKHMVDDDVGDGTFFQTAVEIAQNMGSPDVVALQEMQDNDGAEVSDEVSADRTYKGLIEDIVKAGGPRYEFIDLPPENGKEGGMPGGNIRNGFLYNPQRVKLDPTSVYRLEDPAFEGARRPVVATFIFNHGGQDERVTLMSVHNKSKRGGSEATSDQREVSSQAVNTWAKDHAPKNAHEHLGVLGDRNAYSDEQPMKLETADGALRDLETQLPVEKRYSSQFDGRADTLDHTTVKSSVPVLFDIVHMNSDFDNRARPSDHDGMVSAWEFGANPTPEPTPSENNAAR
jgi:uncharacterized protein